EAAGGQDDDRGRYPPLGAPAGATQGGNGGGDVTLTIHPVANLFPEMGAAEFTQLVDDIREHGQREPIITWRGQVVDGRHRLRACTELGVEPILREHDGDEDSLPALVVSLNLRRRHLDESQRGIVAGRLANMQSGA